MKDTFKGMMKSKTMIFAGMLSLAAPALEALPEARAFLGDNYGLALVALSAIVGLLRYLTTKPLDEK